MFKTIFKTVICGSAMAACAMSANAQTLVTSGSNVGIGGTDSNSALYIKSSKQYVLTARDPKRNSYGPENKDAIYVTIDGRMSLAGDNAGINILSQHGYGAKMFFGRTSYSDLLGSRTQFELNTNSYPGAYYPIVFYGSEFHFTKGDVTVHGKLTCKDELNVAEVNSEKIRTSDITVDMNNAADYVFEENYNLKSLGEVESFVKENKHLPGIPSAAEMAKNGMSVSEMSNLLLEKVEELTLHMIQLEKENKALKAKVGMLEK